MPLEKTEKYIYGFLEKCTIECLHQKMYDDGKVPWKMYLIGKCTLENIATQKKMLGNSERWEVTKGT